MRKQNILVLGGTGFIGGYLAARLISLGRRVVAPTRRRNRARPLILLPTIDVVDADIHDDATLARLIAGQDAVINLVGILNGAAPRPAAAGGPSYGPQFAQAHVELPRRLVAACERAGVRRLLHVSALGADSNGPSMYLRSKGDGEAVIGAARNFQTTIFRPSVVFGRGDRFLTRFADLAALMPVLPLGGAGARLQPIWVEDVTAAIANSLEAEETYGRTYELCGPRIYTLGELASLSARASGHPRRVIALGQGAARVVARLMELLPGEPLVSRDNLDSLRVDAVASQQPYEAPPELGFRPTPLELEAAIYLGGTSPQTRFDRYRARAHR
jgi:NADH dehydrogenase